MPEHCAHGYQTLEDCTGMHYMASGFYTPDAVHGARFDDPRSAFQWPLTAAACPTGRWPRKVVVRVWGDKWSP